MHWSRENHVFTSGSSVMLQEQHDARQFDASGAIGRCLRYHTSEIHWQVTCTRNGMETLPNMIKSQMISVSEINSFVVVWIFALANHPNFKVDTDSGYHCIFWWLKHEKTPANNFQQGVSQKKHHFPSKTINWLPSPENPWIFYHKFPWNIKDLPIRWQILLKRSTQLSELARSRVTWTVEF